MRQSAQRAAGRGERIDALLRSAGSPAPKPYDTLKLSTCAVEREQRPVGRRGNLLMSFLGVVILHFGFRIHAQRRLMMRHGPEILGSTALSALFSLFATAAAARAAGLEPGAVLLSQSALFLWGSC